MFDKWKGFAMKLRTILILSVSVIICISTTGCATILGGIIGYQSGELLAGAAIGAAVDFGGDIVNAVGGVIEGDPNKKRKVITNTQQGYIRLQGSGCDHKRIPEKLQQKLTDNGYRLHKAEQVTYFKSSTTDMATYNWACISPTNTKFGLEIITEKNQDTRIYIKLDEQDAPAKGMITSQISESLRQIHHP